MFPHEEEVIEEDGYKITKKFIDENQFEEVVFDKHGKTIKKAKKKGKIEPVDK